MVIGVACGGAVGEVPSMEAALCPTGPYETGKDCGCGVCPAGDSVGTNCGVPWCVEVAGALAITDPAFDSNPTRSPNPGTREGGVLVKTGSALPGPGAALGAAAASTGVAGNVDGLPLSQEVAVV